MVTFFEMITKDGPPLGQEIILYKTQLTDKGGCETKIRWRGG